MNHAIPISDANDHALISVLLAEIERNERKTIFMHLQWVLKRNTTLMRFFG